MAQAIQTVKVDVEEARKFSKVWTYGSVAIPLPDVALTFATDFANVVLNALMIKIQAAVAQNSQVKPRVIMEGINEKEG
jgi:hypothetical protein